MMTEQRDGHGGRYGVLIDWDHAKRIGTIRSDPLLLRSVWTDFLLATKLLR